MTKHALSLIQSEQTRSNALPTPAQLRDSIPLALLAQKTRDKARRDIAAILEGRDDRLLIICGPCSIHDTHAAMEYALRLRKLAQTVSDHTLVVMRTYFEKPRTTVGWKGLLYDPHLNNSKRPQDGIRIARQLLASINAIGLPCATEFLNPTVAPYLEDAIAYGCIGARTSESQTHRELASSLPMPIGLKNGIDSPLKTTANSLQSARSPHTIFATDTQGIPQIIETPGNSHAHIILRGTANGPNYTSDHVASALDLMESNSQSRPLVIDCSHGNSRKKHCNQQKVVADVISQVSTGQNRIAGLMLESNLVAGNQPFRSSQPHCSGQSITDACIGWEETESLVKEIAAAKASTLENRTPTPRGTRA
ncbi:MAG: 3-deoxy-7-phosphoheptulonate synthase [Verrucomicrobiota bacterium]